MRLEELPETIRIDLGPLAGTEVGELMADVLGAAPTPDLLTAGEWAGGNPLLVVELAEWLREQGAVDISGGEARLVAERVPHGVQAMLTRRLDRLSPGARELLDLGAVIGANFSLEDLTEMVDRPVPSLQTSLREMVHAGVLVTADDAFAFRHKLVREVVHDRLAEPVRTSMHRTIAARMLQRGDTAISAAAHLMGGTTHGDQQGLAGLDKATQDVLVSSPSTAAELALRALELTDPMDAEYVTRAEMGVVALMAGWRLGEATELARSTLARPGLTPVAAARLRVTLSSILFMSGENVAALAEATRVIDARSMPDELYTAAELARLLALMAQDDWTRVRGPAVAILAGASRPGAEAALAGAVTALGLIAWDEGRMAAALGFLRAAVRRADAGPTQEARRNYPRLGLANMLITSGEFDQAATVIRDCREEIDRLGDTLWTAAPAIPASRLHLACGRLDEARAEAEVGLAIAEEVGTSFFVPLGAIDAGRHLPAPR